jgi:hypothetical protein
MLDVVNTFFEACASSNLLDRLQLLNLRSEVGEFPLSQLPPNIRFLRLATKRYMCGREKDEIFEFPLADNIKPVGVLDNIRALSLKVPRCHNVIAWFRKYFYFLRV